MYAVAVEVNLRLFRGEGLRAVGISGRMSGGVVLCGGNVIYVRIVCLLRTNCTCASCPPYCCLYTNMTVKMLLSLLSTASAEWAPARVGEVTGI